MKLLNKQPIGASEIWTMMNAVKIWLTFWDGIAILEVAIAALQDANFHSEAEVLEQMVKFLEQTDETPVYRLEIKDK